MANAEAAAEDYRLRAAKEQALANTATLDNVRRMHEFSAAKWREMADMADRGSVGRGLVSKSPVEQ